MLRTTRSCTSLARSSHCPDCPCSACWCRHKLWLEEEDRRIEVVNAKDRDGRTPLHLSALRGSRRIAQLLLEAGAGTQIGDRNR